MTALVVSFLVGAGVVALMWWWCESRAWAKARVHAPLLPPRVGPYDGSNAPSAPPPPPVAPNKAVLVATPGWSK